MAIFSALAGPTKATHAPKVTATIASLFIFMVFSLEAKWLYSRNTRNPALFPGRNELYHRLSVFHNICLYLLSVTSAVASLAVTEKNVPPIQVGNFHRGGGSKKAE